MKRKHNFTVEVDDAVPLTVEAKCRIVAEILRVIEASRPVPTTAADTKAWLDAAKAHFAELLGGEELNIEITNNRGRSITFDL